MCSQGGRGRRAREGASGSGQSHLTFGCCLARTTYKAPALPVGEQVLVQERQRAADRPPKRRDRRYLKERYTRGTLVVLLSTSFVVVATASLPSVEPRPVAEVEHGRHEKLRRACCEETALDLDLSERARGSPT